MKKQTFKRTDVRTYILELLTTSVLTLFSALLLRKVMMGTIFCIKMGATI